MAPRRDQQTNVETRLAALRVRAGVSQAHMARTTGISSSTYWRLERGRIANPPLRYLVNCAIALGVELDDVIEDAWREWLVLDAAQAGEPPSVSR